MESSQPVIVSTRGADAATRQRISRAARANRVRQIAAGLYTTRLGEPLADICRRHAYEIAGLVYPGGVIGYRTALEGRLGGRDVMFITHDGPELSVPGLTLRPVAGPGALPTDRPLGANLYLAGMARVLLENLTASRSRKHIARSAGPAAVEDVLDRRAALRGRRELGVLREQARRVAPSLGLEAEQQQLERLIDGLEGALQADAPLTVAGRARARGEPIDSQRLARFEAIAAGLSHRTMPVIARGWPESAEQRRAHTRNAAFFESYFSNYIEGTEFEVEAARAIVFDAVIPDARPADAHDIREVYALAHDEHEGVRIPEQPQALIAQLRAWHHALFRQRPAIRPGQFKAVNNRAGRYTFVVPDQVIGTLKAGWPLARSLADPVARALAVHYLVSEVHPFDDGNGRLARLMMNAELARCGLARAVIPTALRDDYLDAVRLLSREQEPAGLLRVIETGQRLHQRLPLADYQASLDRLTEAGAFDPPSRLTRFRLPGDSSERPPGPSMGDPDSAT